MSVYLRYDKEAIKAACPIADVIERYTGNSEKRNHQISCPSPDHPDKDPSATIYEDTNTCRCHRCGTSFDPIGVVEMNTGLSFIEAMKTLIEDFNLPLEQVSNINEVRAARQAMKDNKPVEQFPVSPESAKVLKQIGMDIYETQSKNAEYYREILFYEDEQTGEIHELNWTTDKAYPDGSPCFAMSAVWKDETGKVVRDEENGIFPEIKNIQCEQQGYLYGLPKYITHKSIVELWKDKDTRTFAEDLIMQKCEDFLPVLEEHASLSLKELSKIFRAAPETTQKAISLKKNVEAYKEKNGKEPSLNNAQQIALDRIHKAEHNTTFLIEEYFFSVNSKQAEALKSVRDNIKELQSERAKGHTPQAVWKQALASSKNTGSTVDTR